jgi:hypothetical protein
MSDALISAKIVISAKDGSIGFLEQSKYKGIEGRVFRLAREGVFMEQCSLDAFNADGARARWYGTNYNLDEIEVG